MDSTERVRRTSAALLPVVAALFFLSGAVGLLYEVAWFRRLHLVFGVSIFAIGAVATAFMLGLAAGSRWAGSSRWLQKNPLASYAWLEVGIALYALAFPALVGWLEGSYVLIFRLLEGHFLIQSIVRFVLGFVLLLPPTFLMGATLPALAQAVAAGSPGMAGKVGWLYAVNTLGGVLGTLAAGFYTLEHFGILGSIRLGLGGNLVVAVSAFLLARHPVYRNRERPLETAASDSAGADCESPGPFPLVFAAITVMVTGLVSMAAELVWTRALVFFIHNSTYAFSGVLAVYLLGISAGAAFGARLVRRSDAAMPWLAATLAAVCLGMLLSIGVYRNLPGLAKTLLGGARLGPGLAGEAAGSYWIVGSWAGALAAIFGQVAAVLLLPAFLFGLVFPLALRLAQTGRDTAAGVVGRLYAANTIGCVVGTILGTFVLVTVFGTRLALLLLAWLPAPMAVWAMLKGVRGRMGRVVLPGLLALALFVGSLLAAPAGFYRELFERRFGRVVWFSEGVSETVAVCEHPDGSKWVQYSDGRGASGTVSFRGGWLYAHLPLLLHPDPHSALVICFGTGNTLGAASRHPLEVLDGVELSSAVVDASHIFSETNHEVARNPGVNIIIEDGRNYLLATDKRYDVITEEPPLVHTAGVVNLYSKDFYKLCSDRMTEDGIMAVWLATWELEELEMRMLVRAFVEAFPFASVWDCTHFKEWLLIGSRKPLKVDLDDLERRMSEPQLAADLRRIGGIESPADLLALYLKGRRFLLKFAGEVDPVTDDKTVVDYTTPRQARANFGLGESLTGGLHVLGVGRHGFRTEMRPRDFDSVYVFREPVKPLIGSYGSRDREEFLHQVRVKKMQRELQAAQGILADVMSLAGDFRSRGQFHKALETLNHGLTLVPPAARADIFAGAATLYQDLGYDAEALQALGKALAIDPHHERAGKAVERHRSAGVAALQDKDYARAAAVFGQLTSSSLARWNDWLNYGIALTNLKRYDEARKASREVLRLKPDNAAVRRMLGRIALETSDFEEARVQFEMECRLAPDDSLAWYYNVYAAWHCQGDEAALEKLAAARARGFTSAGGSARIGQNGKRR